MASKRKSIQPIMASLVEKSDHKQNLNVLYHEAGYTVELCDSIIPDAGVGVKITKGCVLQNTLVAMYPGTIYEVYEPLLFQSLGNPFIFRCIDGLLIDGSDKGISKYLYKSCAGRDRVGPYFTCDTSWLTKEPVNPLAIGQYVNNQSKGYPANVAYQEFDVPVKFNFHFRKYFPNIFYSTYNLDVQPERLLRTVVLVAIRDIKEGEELFSTYFTVVH